MIMPESLYKADIAGGSLKVPESRIIADLLLRGVDEKEWRDAIEVENALQKRSPRDGKATGLFDQGATFMHGFRFVGACEGWLTYCGNPRSACSSCQAFPSFG